MVHRRGIQKVKQFVLIGPAGKQAGRTDQRDLALQIAAIQKTETGHGGGIIGLLLPKTKRQWSAIAKLRSKGYFAKEVKIRNSIRSKAREIVTDDDLLSKLANHFHDEKSNSPRAKVAIVREFSIWVSEKIRHCDPNIVKLLSASQLQFLSGLGADWWKVQIKLRRRKK
jgi:hypothetical protein